VRLKFPSIITKLLLFQSTHPRGVRLFGDINLQLLSSFNPRTRAGCDGRQRCPVFGDFCFNPRTRAGCDLLHAEGYSFRLCFNPRTRAGCDMGPGTVFMVFCVSIHAPARGATIPFFSHVSCILVSIHAPARGATEHGRLVINGGIGFNPRTRAGCDIKRKLGLRGVMVSIHAPARGATHDG